jgi:hypothetical protein
VITEGEPLSAEVRCRRRISLRRTDWEVRIEADARMRATAERFLVETELVAYEDGTLLTRRVFDTRIERIDQ